MLEKFFNGKVRPHPSFFESQILQNSSKILTNYVFLIRILRVGTKMASFASLLQR